MEIKTYDRILSDICDEFDNLITPKRITRSNTNILYLLLKAYAKGNEVINNLVVTLRNKFDPERCADEDLISIAKLVGTSMYEGSSSGLVIEVTNTSSSLVVFERGTYTFKQDEDTTFILEHNKAEDIPYEKGQNKVQFIAMSSRKKPVHVTAQNNITLTGVSEDGSSIEIDERLSFSCLDNKGLQGALPESNLAFRKRIISGTSTATLFNKMETEINNLPYIYSCRLRFNASTSAVMEGNVEINPYNLLVVISGAPDEKVAEIIASYGVYETMAVPEIGKYIDYENDVFLSNSPDPMVKGFYRINYIEPIVLEYGLKIYYEIDNKAITDQVVQDKIKSSLEIFNTSNDYKSLITERDFSEYISNLGINTLQILNVDLVKLDERGEPLETVDYIRVPKINVAKLNIDKVEFPPVVEAVQRGK